MIYLSPFNDGDHGLLDLPDSLVIAKSDVFEKIPEPGDIVVTRYGSQASVARVLQRHESDFVLTRREVIPWLVPGYLLFKVQPLFKLDLLNEDVPGGPMAKTYAKGAAAAVEGKGMDSFEGTPGTAVHTVWLKGWFFNYLLAR